MMDENRSSESKRNADSSSESEAAEIEQLRRRVDQLEAVIEYQTEKLRRSPEVRPGKPVTGVRLRSRWSFLGLPLYDIAMGPDAESGQPNGHARGIVAVGDFSTGIIAIGGMSQGLIAVGGCCWGLLTVGGCTIGLLAGIGGVAAGGVVLGGVAIGLHPAGGLVIPILPELAEKLADHCQHWAQQAIQRLRDLQAK